MLLADLAAGRRGGDLTIPRLSRGRRPLEERRGEKITEVVLALNPTLEGDGTGMYLAEQLQQRGEGQPAGPRPALRLATGIRLEGGSGRRDRRSAGDVGRSGVGQFQQVACHVEPIDGTVCLSPSGRCFSAKCVVPGG